MLLVVVILLLIFAVINIYQHNDSIVKCDNFTWKQANKIPINVIFFNIKFTKRHVLIYYIYTGTNVELAAPEKPESGVTGRGDWAHRGAPGMSSD